MCMVYACFWIPLYNVNGCSLINNKLKGCCFSLSQPTGWNSHMLEQPIVSILVERAKKINNTSGGIEKKQTPTTRCRNSLLTANYPQPSYLFVISIFSLACDAYEKCMPKQTTMTYIFLIPLTIAAIQYLTWHGFQWNSPILNAILLSSGEMKREGKTVKRATKVIDIFGLGWGLWREGHSHMVAYEQETKCRKSSIPYTQKESVVRHHSCGK